MDPGDGRRDGAPFLLKLDIGTPEMGGGKWGSAWGPTSDLVEGPLPEPKASGQPVRHLPQAPSRHLLPALPPLPVRALHSMGLPQLPGMGWQWGRPGVTALPTRPADGAVGRGVLHLLSLWATWRPSSPTARQRPVTHRMKRLSAMA